MDNNQELNFCIEFNLSRNGMIEEIKTEFDVLRICFTEQNELVEKYQRCIQRIMVMPLRKLLCEKNSVLLKVCPDFKMPSLQGPWIELDSKLKMIRPPLILTSIETWVSIEEWLNANVAYFDKTASESPTIIAPYVFQVIQNKLSKTEKLELLGLYELKEILVGQDLEQCYVKKHNDETNNQKVYTLLKKANYYDLSVYNFIKHLSDKQGAHIDIGHGPVIELVNNKDNNGHNLILYFCIYMIWAAKKQVPELESYWPEMDEIIKEIIK